MRSNDRHPFQRQYHFQLEVVMIVLQAQERPSKLFISWPRDWGVSKFKNICDWDLCYQMLPARVILTSGVKCKPDTHLNSCYYLCSFDLDSYDNYSIRITNMRCWRDTFVLYLYHKHSWCLSPFTGLENSVYFWDINPMFNYFQSKTTLNFIQQTFKKNRTDKEHDYPLCWVFIKATDM